MKLCDRCRVSGCLLDYLGTACQHAREQECPDVQPNRAELIANMSLNEMATEMVAAILYELCEDGVPNKEQILHWLSSPPSDDEILSNGFSW